MIFISSVHCQNSEFCWEKKNNEIIRTDQNTQAHTSESSLLLFLSAQGEAQDFWKVSFHLSFLWAQGITYHTSLCCCPVWLNATVSLHRLWLLCWASGEVAGMLELFAAAGHVMVSFSWNRSKEDTDHANAYVEEWAKDISGMVSGKETNLI